MTAAVKMNEQVQFQRKICLAAILFLLIGIGIGIAIEKGMKDPC